MSRPNQVAATVRDVIQLMRVYPARWLAPAIAVSVLVALYALTRSTVWEASQALIVRDEAGNKSERQGRFHMTDEMKTTQATILELAKSRAVAEAALVQAGPPSGEPVAQWPSPGDVGALQSAMKITPPKGVEFGTTEVFYIKVRDQNRERAISLADAVSTQLQSRFQALRDAKAQSMIAELSKTVSVAKADLDEATLRLTEMESKVGSDLAELRILQESPSGDSDLRRTAIEIENELRQFRSAQQANQELLNLLVAAQKDAGNLLATPNRLLESQPALRRLKDGLVDAQLNTARLQGTMSEIHPRVVAAKESEAEVARHLHDELSLAIRGVEVDLRLTDARVHSLESQWQDRESRLGKLAGVRAEYANLSNEARHRGEILKTAEQAQAEARASQASAHAASLISRIDAPECGEGPLGPSRGETIVFGMIGGLVIGLGILFLTSQANVPADIAASNGSAHGTIYQPSPVPAAILAAANGHSTAAHGTVGSLSLKQALKRVVR